MGSESRRCVNIGIFSLTGAIFSQRTIAVVGSSVAKPQYYKTTIGALEALSRSSGITRRGSSSINGDVLAVNTLMKKDIQDITTI